MRKRYSRSYTVLSFLTMFSYRELPSADLFFLRKTGPLPSFPEGRGRYIHANVTSVRTQTSRILACSRFRSSKVSGFFPGSRSRAAG